MDNLEVVRRAYPCAQYMDPAIPGSPDPDRPKCRWCKELHHVRPQGSSTTLCAHACTTMEMWVMLEDWHPEDVPAIDRCLVCFQAIEKMKRESERTARI